MSGFEIAGAVLGSLPLLISALEHYREGLQPLKAFINWNSDLPKVIRRLRTQQVLYEAALKSLLTRIVPDETESMISTPNEGYWKDIEIQTRLQKRLDITYPAVKCMIADIEGVMIKIAKALGLYEDLDLSDDQRTSRSQLEAILIVNPWENGVFRFRRAAKFGKNSRRIGRYLDELEKSITILERLTTRSEQPEPYEANTKSAFAVSLRRVRTYAITLHSILCIIWKCNCKTSHKAKLRLERRILGSKNGSQIQSVGKLPIDPNFSMLFSVPTANGMMKWQEVNFKVLPRELLSQDTTDACPTAKHGLRVTFSPDMSIQEKAQQKPSSHTKLKEIEDLCSVLCEMKTPGFGLGFYLDSEGKLRGPYPAASSDDSASTDQSITLAELLGKKVQWKGRVCTLTRKERYKLAVTLASSLYQLESTPWMTTALAKRDIVFSKAQEAALRPVNIEYPYVSKSFPDQVSQVDCAESPASISSGSSSLLALGILLLELYTGRPFEEPQIDSKLNNLSRLMIWSTAAKDWLVEEDGDLAAGWTSAVSYCIDGFKQGPVLSEEDATKFRQSLLEQVVLPLHEETERFLGNM